MTIPAHRFIFILLISLSIPSTSTAQTVSLPDPNLRAAIAAELGKASSDTITVSDMAALTSLEARKSNISDLTGLEHAIHLTSLALASNSISDISAVAGLTNLRSLNLDRNLISDISALAGLTNLRSLNLSWNSISDISALARLINLTSLDLSGNSISDTSSLAGLINLTSLNLNRNNISDISALAGLTKLTRLYLDRNSILDLSALVANAGLGSGDTVNVKGNPLSALSIDTHIPAIQGRGVTVEFDYVVDIPDFNLRNAIAAELGKAAGDTITTSDMATLTQFTAISSKISDLTGLEHAINLESLDLVANSISDISTVAGLTNLRSLDLTANSISDISAVAGLTNLRSLDLDQNLVSDFSVVAGLTNLIALNLSWSSISDISVLAGLINLTSLDLSWNSISDISALAGLINLTWLGLNRNNISDISAVGGLTKLRTLNLSENSISDISAVGGLTKLIRLDLDRNSISDLSALVANAGLGSGDTVDVKDNPLSALSIDTHIPALQSREVIVSFDDRAHPALLKISGDNQKGAAFAPLSQPFVVEVRDERGQPFAGVSVVFTVTEGGGTLSITHTTTGAHGRAQSTLTLGPNLGTNTVSVSATEIERVETFNAISDALPTEYRLSIPIGISLIHVPLKVTAVDGAAQTIESISDLYDVLGGASTVNFLITYDSATQGWLSYFVPSDKDTPADRRLTADMGIIAGLITPVSVQFRGDPLGTDGSSAIALSQGLNVVGLPLRDSRVNRVSHLFALDGIGGNVPVIILADGGEFKSVGRAGDPGDIAITGGQSFIMTAQRAATVVISGAGWYNASGTAAAPPATLKGIEVGDTTPVLALRGAIVDEGMGLNNAGFRVTIKNLSTGRAVSAITSPDEAGYRSTVVDIQTGRAATIGDILEISARSPNPFIGVKPLQYTLTAEDVKQSLIQLPELVTYQIPAETELLSNYPNPFNPETWIPYRLAEDAFVTLTIYDQTGQIVHTIDVGHQTAAIYENRSKAIYWDGRNEIGEQVASGVYFFHLFAGNYSATRKMVILK